VAHLDNVVNVVAHRDKQVKEHLRAAFFHLHLHRAAALEGFAAVDNESKEMGAEPRVAGRRVRISESSTAQDRRHVNTRLQALLSKSKTLQFWQAETKRSAVDNRVP